MNEQNIIDNLTGLDGLKGALGELAALLKRNAPAPKIRQAAQKVRENAKKSEFLMSNLNPGEKFLIAKIKELNADDQKSLAAGILKLTDYAFYHNFTSATTLSSIVELIQPSVRPAVGVSNFEDNGKIPLSYNMAIDFISLAYAAYVTANGYFDTEITGMVNNAKFANSEFEMLVNNESMVKLPLRYFTEARKSQPNEFKDTNFFAHNGFNLDNPVLIRSGDKVQYRIHVPESITIAPGASNSHIIRVSVFGACTRRIR